MAGLFVDLQIEVLVSFVFALAAAAVVRLKAWQWGELDQAPSHARVVVVSFVVFLAIFLALRHLDGAGRALAIVLAASFGLAVSMMGRASLATMNFVRKLGIAFAVCLAFWGFSELLGLLGFDLFAPRNPYR